MKTFNSNNDKVVVSVFTLIITNAVHLNDAILLFIYLFHLLSAFV